MPSSTLQPPSGPAPRHPGGRSPRPLHAGLMALLVLASAAAMTACATAPAAPSDPVLPPQVARALAASADRPPGVLLLGEQHDDALHQQLHASTVAALAARQQLAGLVLEMADQGTSTQGLSPQADEVAVRSALRWSEDGWPWAAYGPVVMAAVRAGVPVVGGNLPRAQMRSAMADADLERALTPEALGRQQEAIGQGHCGLLPASQIGPMTRIQIARDRSMAQTLTAQMQMQMQMQMQAQTRDRRLVVLVAGHAHVDTELGVPRHLPAGLAWAAVTWPLQPPQKDYCAQLRQQWGASAPAPAPSR